MKGKNWMERKTNEEILIMIDDRRTLRILIRHYSFYDTVLEGEIEGKRGRGVYQIPY